MKIRALTILMMLASAIPDPASASESCPLPLELTSLPNRNPLIEAEAEAKKENPQLLGVMGYDLLLPKAPGVPYCWSRAGLVHIISGTGDALCNDEHVRLQGTAVEFAGAFNQKLLQLTPKLRANTCSKG